MNIVCVVPMLGRPERVAAIVKSILLAKQDLRCALLFVCSPDDTAVIKACKRIHVAHEIVDWEPGPGDYARKINWALRTIDYEWVLAGASDLHFHPGWCEEALREAEETGRRFVATNDLTNPLVMRGKHATHPFVHRSYIELGTIDEPGLLYHEGYDHQCIDVEASETAMMRGEFVFAQHSHVEHMHPLFRKGKMDETYEKALRYGRHDVAVLRRRRPLWMRPRRAVAF